LYVHRSHVLHYRHSQATATVYDLDTDRKEVYQILKV
jgi:hypothetical protein